MVDAEQAERGGGRLWQRLGSRGEIDAAANAIEHQVMPHPRIALPEEVLPGKASTGLVDLDHGRGAGLGVVTEPGVIKPDGIGDAPVHLPDGKVKAISPCLEHEDLPDGKKESGRINNHPQDRKDDERKISNPLCLRRRGRAADCKCGSAMVCKGKGKTDNLYHNRARVLIERGENSKFGI